MDTDSRFRRMTQTDTCVIDSPTQTPRPLNGVNCERELRSTKSRMIRPVAGKIARLLVKRRFRLL
jgi:hypothetical protein